MLFPIDEKQEIIENTGEWIKIVVAILASILALVAHLASTGSKIVVEKDWIVVIAGGDEDKLAKLNLSGGAATLAGVWLFVVVNQFRAGWMDGVPADGAAVVAAVGGNVGSAVDSVAGWRRFPSFWSRKRCCSTVLPSTSTCPP